MKKIGRISQDKMTRNTVNKKKRPRRSIENIIKKRRNTQKSVYDKKPKRIFIFFILRKFYEKKPSFLEKSVQ